MGRPGRHRLPRRRRRADLPAGRVQAVLLRAVPADPAADHRRGGLPHAPRRGDAAHVRRGHAAAAGDVPGRARPVVVADAAHVRPAVEARRRAAALAHQERAQRGPARQVRPEVRHPARRLRLHPARPRPAPRPRHRPLGDRRDRLGAAARRRSTTSAPTAPGASATPPATGRTPGGSATPSRRSPQPHERRGAATDAGDGRRPGVPRRLDRRPRARRARRGQRAQRRGRPRADVQRVPGAGDDRRRRRRHRRRAGRRRRRPGALRRAHRRGPPHASPRPPGERLAERFGVAVSVGGQPVACPACGGDTVEESLFGPVRCRSIRRCSACGEIVETVR